jgi:hypothetical protein
VKWWQKPLVLVDECPTAAELAVLATELCPGETGVWLNSRGLVSGVAELQRDQAASEPTFRTRRIPLPRFVASSLAETYQAAGVAKGCPDLVIWRSEQESFRLVEVKCPHWDTPTKEQHAFMRAAAQRGIPTTLVEWEFDGGAA